MSESKKISQETIDRLRASRDAGDADFVKEGFDYGFLWASEKAAAAELERLAKYRGRISDEHWDSHFDDQALWNGIGPHASIAQAIIGTDEEVAVLQFWKKVLQGPEISIVTDIGEFRRGFCEGALEVWKLFQAAA